MADPIKPFITIQIAPEEIKKLRYNFLQNYTPPQNDPQLRSVTEGQTLYTVVAQVVKDMNEALRSNSALRAAYPNAVIAVPTHLYVTNSTQLNANYDWITDSLAVTKTMLGWPPEQLKLVVAHELGHKLAAEQKGIIWFDFNHVALANSYRPHAIALCKQAGLTDEQLALLMPASPTPNAQLFNGVLHNAPLDELVKASKKNSQSKQFWNAYSLQQANTIVKSDEACKAEINAVWAHLKEGFVAIRQASSQVRFQNEHEADSVAALTFGRQPVASMLAGLGKQVNQNIWRFFPTSTTHPPFETRIDQLGCSLSEGNGDLKATCPSPQAPSWPTTISQSKAR